MERLLDCVRILAPLVEAERPSLDAKRELSPTLLDALVTAGLFRQCAVHKDGRARPGRAGRPEMRLLFVPADKCRIHDTWHVSGTALIARVDRPVSD